MLTRGRDSNNNVVPLLLDADGNIIISASQLTTTGGKIKVDASGRITITADEPNYLNPTSILAVNVNNSLPAGGSTQTIYTVPANQRALFTFFSMRYSGTVAGVVLNAAVSRGSDVFNFLYQSPPVTNVIYSIVTNILLIAGDVISVTISGATLNDDFKGSAALQRIE